MKIVPKISGIMNVLCSVWGRCPIPENSYVSDEQIVSEEERKMLLNRRFIDVPIAKEQKLN